MVSNAFSVDKQKNGAVSVKIRALLELSSHACASEKANAPGPCREPRRSRSALEARPGGRRTITNVACQPLSAFDTASNTRASRTSFPMSSNGFVMSAGVGSLGSGGTHPGMGPVGIFVGGMPCFLTLPT